MAQITFKGNPIHTAGELPALGSPAPNFTLTGTDLGALSLGQYQGQRVVLNIFPSLDTGVCATSVRQFNARASQAANTTVLCVSADLPFAAKRFCVAEGLDKVVPASTFRSPDFGQTFGLAMVDGPLRGLLARAVLVLDEGGKVIHRELVPEITQEPDYDAAMKAL
ncbi:MAG: thiol peroxidase [Acidobacteria bacterium]|nr:thiol peroxidase [Acidobacteriota bacterium]